MLLAIDTGAPLIAGAFLNTIRDLASFAVRETPTSAPLTPTLRNLISEIDKDAAVNASAEWSIVRYWLTSRVESGALPDDVVRFARWIPRVSRFSFHTGRI